MQCIASLCEGLASFTGPIYTSVVIQKPRTAGKSTIRAPPALDVDKLPQDDEVALQLGSVGDMVASGSPALLAALSFIISTNLSDELFGDVLASYQAMTNMLGLTTPRDAFYTSLAKFAVPTKVVSSVDAVEPPTPRSTRLLTVDGSTTITLDCRNVTWLVWCSFLAPSASLGVWAGVGLTSWRCYKTQIAC